MSNPDRLGTAAAAPITVTGVAQHSAWDREVLPAVEQVRRGLWSIPVPLPNNPLRYVLVYALEHRDGLALIDAGWDTDRAWHALTNGIEQTGHDVTDVTAVVATHVHPDHYGLAYRVRQRTGAWVALHGADAALLEGQGADGLPALISAARDLFAAAGAPELQSTAKLRASSAQFLTPPEPPDRLLVDGQRLVFGAHTLTVVHTPGHTPGHVCLHDEITGLLFTGDHVLPRITGTVGLHGRADHDALGEFLDSLARVAALSDDVDEVLPAHEYRFSGLKQRADELIAHHEHRLAETSRAVAAAPGGTAWDVAQALEWSRPWHDVDPVMRRVAAAETLAHLILLEARQQIRRSAGEPWTWHVTHAASPAAR